MNQQATYWVMIFVIQISCKGLVSSMYEQLLQHSNQKTKIIQTDERIRQFRKQE